MILALRAIGSAIAQVYSHVTAFLVGNVIAIVLSLPLLLLLGLLAWATRSISIIPLGVAFLVGVLPNPCTGGVQFVAHELAGNQYVTWRDYVQGFRRYGRAALTMWLASVVVSVVIVGNIVFYLRALNVGTPVPYPIAFPLLMVWLVTFVLWVSAHLYVFPLLFEQETEKMALVYRNAFLMVLARPRVTIVVVPIWLALLLVMSSTGVATFIGLGLAAAIQHNAAAKVIPTFRPSSST